MLSFRDTGVGMSREAVDRAFEPYFTTKDTGLGLGLAVSHKIISSHGGEIKTHSEEGQGTTVVIALPASLETV